MDYIKLAQRTISMLSSMIESGECHTARTREMVNNAQNGLEQLRQCNVSGQGEQFCECKFIMIIRNSETDVPYCSECGKEVGEQKSYKNQHSQQPLEINKMTKDSIQPSSSQTDVMCWVAVSETKPEIGQWLLVYAKSGRHIAWYNGFQFEDRADYNIEGVTHWMQIPEPPCI